MRQQVRQTIASPTVRAVTGLAGGNSLAMAIGIVGTLIQARYVSPADLGYFRSFAIFTGYAFFLHLGIFGALQRLYPYYMGKGMPDKAIAVAEIAQAWNVVVSLVVGSLFALLALSSAVNNQWQAMLGWSVQAVAVASFIYGGYLNATYRSGHEFTAVAKSTVIGTIASTLTLPLFLLWPYVALALRSSLGAATTLIYLHVKRPLRLRWRFNRQEWYELIREGLPIFVASYGASTGWAVIESTLIVTFLGAPALGLWSMSFMLLEAANKVPQALTAVYIPRVTETYGRTESVADGLQVCRQPILAGLPVSALLMAAIWITLPLIVPILMPKYVAAIPTMVLMMLILPLIVLELPYALLVAIGGWSQQNVATYVGLTCFILFALGAIHLGFGLTGVVGASLIGRVTRLAFAYVFLLIARHRQARTAYQSLKGEDGGQK